MEISPLTEWEKRERDGLLALETTFMRNKRHEAENPNAPSAVLERIAARILGKWGNGRQEWAEQGYLVAEAIVTHPNTPPNVLLSLLNMRNLIEFPCARAICQNPVTPLLCLEVPDFWERVSAEMCELLLANESLSSFTVAHLTERKQTSVAQSARFHVAFAGGAQTQNEWKDGLFVSGFPKYAERHFPPFDLYYLRQKGVSHQWMDRLYAVLQLPLTEVPFPERTQEQWSRSPVHLLQHLARDGNRLVRWAAQTRLADPNFVFTWHDGE